jgi:glutamine phosphoribosylpyrophosphate amidotransferase
MCGVIGVSLGAVTDEDLDLVRRVFKESVIRGKHATGLTYLSNGRLTTRKSGQPVEEFFKNYDLEQCVNEDGGLYLIGHIRYSTSDLRYHQPFANDEFGIVHNGVISQESQDEWMFETQTANDSELVLHSLAVGRHPLHDFHPASMAVCTVGVDKEITGFRNEARPLWLTKLDKGVIFTSTRDIAERAGLAKIGTTEKAKMYTIYRYKDGMLTLDDTYDGIYPDIEDLQ